MGYKVANVRQAHGFNMNGCKVVGAMYADVVDTETAEILYSGEISMCQGKVAMLGFL